MSREESQQREVCLKPGQEHVSSLVSWCLEVEIHEDRMNFRIFLKILKAVGDLEKTDLLATERCGGKLILNRLKGSAF